MEAVTVPYMHNDNLNMYYEDIGVGEAIIFIHGSLSRGITTFASQLQAFQFSNRCIYPDMRGHGNTYPTDFNWTSKQLADDVILLMDELDIPKAHIVGHSMGGDIAMYCAINHPSRISSITSISSAGAVNDSILSYLERYRPENMNTPRQKKFIEYMKKEHFAACNGDWKSFFNQTISNCNKCPDFSEEELQKISMPFLLIYGSEDEMVKDYELKRLQNNISHIIPKIMDGAGHFPHIIGQQCNEVNGIILNFITNV